MLSDIIVPVSIPLYKNVVQGLVQKTGDVVPYPFYCWGEFEQWWRCIGRMTIYRKTRKRKQEIGMGISTMYHVVPDFFLF